MSATPQDESDTETPAAEADDYVDGQEEDSFPASDPHSDWSGPPEGDPPERP